MDTDGITHEDELISLGHSKSVYTICGKARIVFLCWPNKALVEML